MWHGPYTAPSWCSELPGLSQSGSPLGCGGGARGCRSAQPSFPRITPERRRYPMGQPAEGGSLWAHEQCCCSSEPLQFCGCLCLSSSPASPVCPASGQRVSEDVVRVFPSLQVCGGDGAAARAPGQRRGSEHVRSGPCLCVSVRRGVSGASVCAPWTHVGTERGNVAAEKLLLAVCVHAAWRCGSVRPRGMLPQPGRTGVHLAAPRSRGACRHHPAGRG